MRIKLAHSQKTIPSSNPTHNNLSGMIVTGRDIIKLDQFSKKSDLINNSLNPIIKYLNNNQSRLGRYPFIVLCHYITVLLHTKFCDSIKNNEVSNGLFSSILNKLGSKPIFAEHTFNLYLGSIFNCLKQNFYPEITEEQALDLCVVLTHRHEAISANQFTKSGKSLIDRVEDIKYFRSIISIGEIVKDLNEKGIHGIPSWLQCIVEKPHQIDYFKNHEEEKMLKGNKIKPASLQSDSEEYTWEESDNTLAPNLTTNDEVKSALSKQLFINYDINPKQPKKLQSDSEEYTLEESDNTLAPNLTTNDEVKSALPKQLPIKYYINPKQHKNNNYISKSNNTLKQTSIPYKIELALFKASFEDTKPIQFEIDNNIFQIILNRYIGIILQTDDSQKEDREAYINYLKNFEFKHNLAKLKVTVFPAYSKDSKFIGHNVSGDTSIIIEMLDKSYYFVFDAPSGGYQSYFTNMLLLRAFETFDNLYRNDVSLAMHAKLLFLLHVCNQKEDFLSDISPNNTGRYPQQLVASSPYVSAIQDDKVATVKINGDCNALLKYEDNSLIFMSAGAIIADNVDNSNRFINDYNKLYQGIDYKVSSRKDIESLQNLTENYKNAQKNYRSPDGGISAKITIPLEIDGKPVKIYLVTDGITDNVELEEVILGMYENVGRINSSIMDIVAIHMQRTTRVVKPDDCARPLIVG